ncbi:MAG: hypothetical protein ABSG46_14225 [Candidatus Binataceae bacterium]|jgi:hypothetical protein
MLKWPSTRGYSAPNGIANLVLRGSTFSYDNTPINGDGNGAVIVGGKNSLIGNCSFARNNWVGLAIDSATNVTVNASAADFKGENEVSVYEVENWLVTGPKANSDNWRGYAGGFTGTDADGVKAARVHSAQLSNLISENYWTSGLWLDTDVANVTVTSTTIPYNLTHGLMIENRPGKHQRIGLGNCV